jgi:hypothetical protein
MNMAQAEKAIEALSLKVMKLEVNYSTLAAQYKSLLETVSPKCETCGRIATKRVRVFHGAARYAVDVWACEEHSHPESVESGRAA